MVMVVNGKIQDCNGSSYLHEALRSLEDEETVGASMIINILVP